MGTELNPTAPPDPPPDLPAPIRVGPLDLHAALLADSRKATTLAARKQDAADLATFLKAPDPAQACAALVGAGAGRANAVATSYLSWMIGRGLSAGTVNRRLATLRRVVKIARRFGLIDWTIEVDNQRNESLRDTRGPGHSGWLRILERATRDALSTPKGRRDLCIVRLLHDHGLRRSEVTALDRADWDADSARLLILGKGKSDKAPLSVNPPTVLALSRWLEDRGGADGPLFTRLDSARDRDNPERLDGDAILELVARLGARAGLGRRVTPHGLRHQGITRVLELSNGNIDAAQKFARHADPKTTLRYNDNRNDVAGEMARLLGADA